MTREELDRRIADARFDANAWSGDNASLHDLAIKQLIRDCIEAVTPEKWVTEADKLRARGQRVVASSPLIEAQQATFNKAISDVEANTKELLG